MTLRRGIIAAALMSVLLLASGTAAQDRPTLNIREFTLGNGLNVTLLEERSAPVVAVHMAYAVGAAHAPTERSGIAYMAERLMYGATAHLTPGGGLELLAGANASTESFTESERTVFSTTLLAEFLPLALWIEAERMASIQVTGPDVNALRAALIEEYSAGVLNAPYGEAYQFLYTLAYAAAPYRQRVLGVLPDVNAITAQEVFDFISRYYVPNNAALVIAGDIDLGQAEGLVRATFDPIPAAEEPALPDFTLGPAQAQVYDFIDPLADVPAYFIAYPLPPRRERDFAAVEVLAQILDDGDQQGRLTAGLLAPNWALDLAVQPQGGRYEGLLTVTIFANGGVPLTEIEALYQTELQLIIDGGITAGELATAVNTLRTRRLIDLEPAAALADAVQLGRQLYDDPNGVLNEIERYGTITAEEVQRAAATYLQRSRAVLLLIEPALTGEGTSPIVPDPALSVSISADDTSANSPRAVLTQTEPPPPLAPRPLALPEVRETRLDNGLTVLTMQRADLPLVLAALYLPGGTSADPAPQAGLATLAASALTRGTTTRSAQALASALQSTGISLGTDVTADALRIATVGQRASAPLAFELLADIALNPAFAEADIRTAQAELLADAEAAVADTSALADRGLYRQLYGAHPYGPAASPATVSSITPDMVRFFYTTQAQPSRAVLVIAGALSHDEAINLARQHFGGWAGLSAGPAPALPDPAAPAVPGISLIAFPGSLQADVVVGALSLPGADANREALYVMSTLLGGGPFARLNVSLRDELALASDAFAFATAPASRGVFAIATATAPEDAAAVVSEIQRQLALLRDQPIQAAEVRAAAEAIVAGNAFGYESLQFLADAVMEYRLIGRPASDLATEADRLRRVDGTALQLLARQLLAPERLAIVVVGEAALIEPGLAALGPVTRAAPE